MSKARSPRVTHHENGQIMVFEHMKDHTQTVRYRLVGSEAAAADGAAIDNVYVYRHAMPDPQKPPRRIVVGITFED